MKTVLDTLTEGGLSPSAAEIYLALVELGELTVPKILEKVKLSRAMIYEVLPELLAGGYVEYRKDGKIAYYKPVHPGKLLDLVNQKKRDVALLEDEMKTTIQSLSGKFNLAFNRPGVKFFEGVEGLKEIYKDTLREQKPIYAILSPAVIEPSLKDWLDKTYVKERVVKGIEAQVIASSSAATDAYHEHDKESLRETVVVPNSKFPIDVEIDLYGENQIAFISFGKAELIGVTMESPAIYTSMKTFFQLAWAEAKRFSLSRDPRIPS
ncbi:MAG: helix-turn-helix domain-containing protein [Patescibacteria group bacterium]